MNERRAEHFPLGSTTPPSEGPRAGRPGRRTSSLKTDGRPTTRGRPSSPAPAAGEWITHHKRRWLVANVRRSGDLHLARYERGILIETILTKT